MQDNRNGTFRKIMLGLGALVISLFVVSFFLKKKSTTVKVEKVKLQSESGARIIDAQYTEKITKPMRQVLGEQKEIIKEKASDIKKKAIETSKKVEAGTGRVVKKIESGAEKAVNNIAGAVDQAASNTQEGFAKVREKAEENRGKFVAHLKSSGSNQKVNILKPNSPNTLEIKEVNKAEQAIKDASQKEEKLAEQLTEFKRRGQETSILSKKEQEATKEIVKAQKIQKEAGLRAGERQEVAKLAEEKMRKAQEAQSEASRQANMAREAAETARKDAERAKQLREKAVADEKKATRVVKDVRGYIAENNSEAKNILSDAQKNIGAIQKDMKKVEDINQDLKDQTEKQLEDQQEKPKFFLRPQPTSTIQTKKEVTKTTTVVPGSRQEIIQDVKKNKKPSDQPQQMQEITEEELELALFPEEKKNKN
jgi:hypothetical protein